MENNNTVIFDIDGTLANLEHRLHYITGKHRDYDSFYGAVKDDGFYWDIGCLLHLLSKTNKVVLCSGRPERTRADTMRWAVYNGLENTYDRLYMRSDGDTRPDHIIKSELLDQIIADGYSPWLAVDDRSSIVKMWRERGLTCLQCRDWSERQRNEKGLLVLMVGPSGAGKSHWLSENHIDQHDVVSSDQFRQNICGDFKDQTKNDQVFSTLHAVVKARIDGGLLTFVDATNIRNADRKALVALANGSPVEYVVINRSMEEKYRDAGWRAEIEGFDLIAKHEQTFRSNLKDILNGDGLPNVKVTFESA